MCTIPATKPQLLLNPSYFEMTTSLKLQTLPYI
jgi:hypothetical protein